MRARDPLAVRLGIPLLIAASVFAAFWPALFAEFVNWDDEGLIVDNFAFRGFSPSHLEWMFTTTHMGPYQPLSWLTWAFDFRVWGLDPFGFHFTNVVLHALTAIAVYSLARELLCIARPGASTSAPSLPWLALFAALFFAIHPLRCESVAWVSERRDVLSGLFYVGTVIAYLRSATSAERHGRWLAFAFLSFVAALLSKASGITLPFVLLLLDAWPLRRWSKSPEELRRALIEKLPFVAVAIVFAYVAVRGQVAEAGTMRGLDEHGIVERFAQAAYAVCFYPWKSLVPTGLVPLYELPRPLDPREARFVVSALVAAAITAIVLVRARRSPAIAVAWIAFVVLLAPVSGLVQAGTQLVADRYSYLPCVPLALLFASGLAEWIDRKPAQRLYVFQAASGVLLILGILTFQQSRVWSSSQSLWSHTFRHAPQSPDALLNFGMSRLQSAARERDAARRRQALDECRVLFEHGVEIAPVPAMWTDLGLVCVLLAKDDPARRGDLHARATQCVERALGTSRELGLSEVDLRVHLASVLMELGRNDEALAMLTEFVREHPDHLHGRRLVSAALVSADRAREAIPHLEHALQLAPYDATLWIRLGLTNERAGNLAHARAALQRAIDARTAALGERASSDPEFQQAMLELRRIDSSSPPRAPQ